MVKLYVDKFKQKLRKEKSMDIQEVKEQLH